MFSYVLVDFHNFAYRSESIENSPNPNYYTYVMYAFSPLETSQFCVLWQFYTEKVEIVSPQPEVLKSQKSPHCAPFELSNRLEPVPAL